MGAGGALFSVARLPALVPALLLIAYSYSARPAQALAPIPTPTLPLHSGLCVDENFALRSILDRAVADAKVFGKAVSLPMTYSIFNGTSSLRTLAEDDLDVLRPSSIGVYGVRNSPAFHRAAAALLLSRGRLEAAHEVVLGVTPHNLDEAEYAATHRGQTDWSATHPLTDTADRIHSIIHRLEGSALGEGNHTGYANAKYWILGGPKELVCPEPHPIRNELRRRVLQHAPNLLNRGIIAGEGKDGRGPIHQVIAGGEKMREVRIPPGEWDDVAFIDVCRLRSENRDVCEPDRLSEEECREIEILQETELLLLIQHELIKAGFGAAAVEGETHR